MRLMEVAPAILSPVRSNSARKGTGGRDRRRYSGPASEHLRAFSRLCAHPRNHTPQPYIRRPLQAPAIFVVGVTTTIPAPSLKDRLKTAEAAGFQPADLARVFRLMRTARRIDDREIVLKRQDKIF